MSKVKTRPPVHARMTELEKKKRRTSEIKEEELQKFIEEESNLNSA